MTHERNWFWPLALTLFVSGSLGCIVVQASEDEEEESWHDEEDFFHDEEDDREEERGECEFNRDCEEGSVCVRDGVGAVCVPDPDLEEEPAPEPQPELPIVLGGHVFAEEGFALPERARLIAVWQVSTASPGYLFKFGEGVTEGDRFELVLDEFAPPAEALNGDGVGAAFLLAVKEDTPMPPAGMLDRASFRMLESMALGISAHHGLIFVAPDAETDLDWTDRFERGAFACGERVPAPEEGGLESFAPIDCDATEVVITSSLGWARWR